MTHHTLRKWSLTVGRLGNPAGALSDEAWYQTAIACISAYFLIYGQIGSF